MISNPDQNRTPRFPNCCVNECSCNGCNVVGMVHITWVVSISGSSRGSNALPQFRNERFTGGVQPSPEDSSLQ
jgi:hypothetical protein